MPKRKKGSNVRSRKKKKGQSDEEDDDEKQDVTQKQKNQATNYALYLARTNENRLKKMRERTSKKRMEEKDMLSKKKRR